MHRREFSDLDVLPAFNFFATVMQVFKRFPLLIPFQYLFAPLSKIIPFLRMEANFREGVKRRIHRRDSVTHLDLFSFLLTEKDKPPKTKNELSHLGSASLQFMFAGFQSMSDWYFSTIVFLLQNPKVYRILLAEITDAFKSYEHITYETLIGLPYLNACLEETLRLFPPLNTGLARLSPGAKVDGLWVPKGVCAILLFVPLYLLACVGLIWETQTLVQTSLLTVSRSKRYFHDPLSYSPGRWLPSAHPLYDTKFSNDDLKVKFAFSISPRGCTGKEMAWIEGRSFLAKLLWQFDLGMVEGQDVNLERDLIHYGFFKKPEVNVRFVPVDRSVQK
jgi:cytochrome P450